MNKNRFRIIFNQLRGLMMVVAENVKSHSASAESGTHSTAASLSPSFTKKQSDMSVILRPLAFSLMCALGLVAIIPNPININTVQAEAKAASNVPGNQRPTVLRAPNGVEVVNIQTPSAAGVSRNVYETLNVPAQGMIFNNSRTSVRTELGGWIQANPWLATGSARVILNEVNSNHPSYLNGYMEVAGSRAEFIIANPNGITCNGCGFINAYRPIITTGIPILNNGDLTGYRVTGGTISIIGNGMDVSRSNYTDIIARAVEVNAGIWANDLKITTGANQVNAANNQATAIAGSGAAPASGFALDVAALGGMYAGKIAMIGTEAGLGVRNAGVISANTGHLTLDINGKLTNSNTLAGTTQTSIQADHVSNTGGRIISQQHLDINTTSLSGDGQILAGGNASVNLTQDYTQTGSGTLQANGNLTLTTAGNVSNQSAILSGQTLTLNAANIDNTVSGELSGLNTYLDTTGGTGTAIRSSN
jgi:filamentous hemagglutinin